MIGHDDSRLRDRDGLGRRLADAAAISAAVLLAKRAARDVTLKSDGSPVCSADLAADHAAKEALALLLPGFPIVSEETAQDIAPGAIFILLDPLDGTREFLAGGDSYCVAIAVICDGRPIAGAIAAPATGRLWFSGKHAYEQDFAADGALLGEARRAGVRAVPGEGPVALVSRFHGDGRSDGIAASMCCSKGIPVSSAVKFGMIASGEADIHVRCGQTMEWDIAAGDAILSAAGGIVLTLEGTLPDYGRSERQFRNPPFVAASSEALARQAIAGDCGG
ncbi:MAG: 3'(2'),5'-bisphosphate nucleotidase CysQ [Hyphomicrobiales bacterium]|nr:MAG: 3'(2'),5'-bisphosphate nucleotidase CysQ [Hyphomicrobiales bacterium]